MHLAHIRLAAFKFLWDMGKQCRQTPQNVASDQGLHCLLTECSIKNLNRNEKHHPTSLETEMECSI